MFRPSTFPIKIPTRIIPPSLLAKMKNEFIMYDILGHPNESSLFVPVD